MYLAEVIDVCDDIEVVVHDDACHMAKFCAHRNRFIDQEQQTERGWVFVKFNWMSKRLAALIWSLDRFHSVNHVDAWCHDHVNPGLPHLQPRLQGINTSRCESVFAWMRGFAGALHLMSRWRFRFFVSEMLDMHNMRIASGSRDHLGHHAGENLGSAPAIP